MANAEENRKLDVQRLEAGGLAVFVTMPTTVAGAVAELRDLAAAVGDLPGAAALDADLVAAVADAYRRRPARRVRYACAVWRDPWMWLGRRTYAADLLGLAGGEPVLDDPATRYPALELETVAGLGPELVLLPSEPYEFGELRRRRAGRQLRRGPGRAGRRPRPHLVRPAHPGRPGRLPGAARRRRVERAPDRRLGARPAAPRLTASFWSAGGRPGQPPASRAAFQVRPQSSRLTLDEAREADPGCPRSIAPPRNSTST